MLKNKHQKKMIYPLKSMRDGLISILHGTIPFASAYMRKNPILTIVTILFHISLLIVPIFLLSHIILWYESWKILYWSIPELLADIMTIFVLLGCVFFLVRRITNPGAKKVSGPADFLLLLAIFVPFFTGFLATHQWGPYRTILILHIISSEVLLILIPFTKLGHMFLFLFTRGYLGAEYGKVMRVNDW